MRSIRRRIPTKLYRSIHRVLPIVCVDLVVSDPQRKNFLLVKRKNQPERGKWYLLGGRIFKNERLASAARRKLKGEIGLRGKIVTQLGIHEYFSKTGYFPGTNSHTIIVVFLAVVRPHANSVKLDSQSSDLRWFRRIDPGWHPYVKKFLKCAGFQEKTRA